MSTSNFREELHVDGIILNNKKLLIIYSDNFNGWHKLNELKTILMHFVTFEQRQVIMQKIRSYK